MTQKVLCIFLIFLGVLLSLKIDICSAAPPSNRPEDSITYWKPFVILPDEDSKVKDAHAIFNRLLSGWKESRIAPTLYVVHSDAGPWAASLDDGSVLLSREAIDLCLHI